MFDLFDAVRLLEQFGHRLRILRDVAARLRVLLAKRLHEMVAQPQRQMMAAQRAIVPNT